jgi:hypothetical protein
LLSADTSLSSLSLMVIIAEEGSFPGVSGGGQKFWSCAVSALRPSGR